MSKLHTTICSLIKHTARFSAKNHQKHDSNQKYTPKNTVSTNNPDYAKECSILSGIQIALLTHMNI